MGKVFTTLTETGTSQKAGSGKFHKAHPKRTSASQNRTNLAEEYPQPNPLGYGMPIVLVYDKQGSLILDLVRTNDKLTEVALKSFTYEFREKEEDQCTIVLACYNPALMDDMDFFKGQFLAVSWGYADGNLRPPLKVVVVDTKEKYDTQGCTLTLVCSDNLSFFSHAQNPVITKIKTAQESIRKFLNPSEMDLADSITKLRGWKAWDFGETSHLTVTNGYAISTGPIKSTTEFPRTSTTDLTNYMVELEDYYKRKGMSAGLNQPNLDSLPAHPSNIDASLIKGIAEDNYTYENLPSARGDGSPITGIQSGPTSDDAPPFPNQTPQLSQQELDDLNSLPYTLHGYHIEVTGKNAQNLLKNTVNAISPYPMEVVGRDGKVVTYNKNRALRASPVREYTWNGGNGNLLEFDYDSNSKYSDDTSVLRNFTVDPKTGALTMKDMVNDPKNVVDAYTPEEASQASFDRAVKEGIVNMGLNLTDPNQLNDLMGTDLFRYSARDETGKPVLIANGGWISSRGPSYFSLQGGTRVQVMGQDNLAGGRTLISIPNQDLSDLAEVTMENEIKNMMRGEQERVKSTAKVLGDPQMVSGIKAKFKGLSKRRNGSYFLTGCIHTIDDSGYTTKYEMYYVGDISVGVNTISSTTSKGAIKKKADDLKNKKIEQHPNSKAIQERGYFLKTDFLKEDYELAAEKVDKDWNIKLPGVFYKVTYRDADNPKNNKTCKIKIPVNPDGTLPKNPLQAFGYDALYDLFNVHDYLKVRIFTDVEEIGSTDGVITE